MAKLNETTVRKLCEALQAGVPRKIACAYAGITPQTFSAWRRRAEVERKAGEPGKYSDAIWETEQAEAQMAFGMVSVIGQAARGGQWQAAAWIMERRWPEEFGRGQDRIKMPEEEVSTRAIEEATNEEVLELIRSEVAA